MTVRRSGDAAVRRCAGASRRGARAAALGLVAQSAVAGHARAQAPAVTLLNVSYDPTREFYQEINAAFTARVGAPGRRRR